MAEQLSITKVGASIWVGFANDLYRELPHVCREYIANAIGAKAQKITIDTSLLQNYSIMYSHPLQAFCGYTTKMRSRGSSFWFCDLTKLISGSRCDQICALPLLMHRYGSSCGKFPNIISAILPT